jgi:hypothetical protein
LIYNSFQNVDQLIADETRNIIRHYLKKSGYSAPLIDLRDSALDSDAVQRLSL